MLGGRAALIARVRPHTALSRAPPAIDSSRRHAAAACCSVGSRGLASATPAQQVPLHAPRGGNPARKADKFGKKVWLVDARSKVLGRLAAEIARVLRGKHKPLYDPSLMTGDAVVVINCKDVSVTGQKSDQKLYRKHSGYTGNLKETNFKDMMQKKPTEAMRLAVRGMLPRNKLRDRLLKQRLLLYEAEAPEDFQDLPMLPLPPSLQPKSK